MDITTTELTVKDDLTEDKYNLITGFEKKLQKHLRKKAALEPLFEGHNPYGKYKPEPLFIEPQGKYLFAHVDGVPAGFAYYNAKHNFYDRSLFIGELFVEKEFRHQGVGSALLERLERTAADSNCKSVALCALTKNKKAFEFYQDNGFSKYIGRDFVMSRDSLKISDFTWSIEKPNPYLRNCMITYYLTEAQDAGLPNKAWSKNGILSKKQSWLRFADVHKVVINGHGYHVLGDPKCGRLLYVFCDVDKDTYAKIAYAMANKKSGLCVAMAYDKSVSNILEQIKGCHPYWEVLYKGL